MRKLREITEQDLGIEHLNHTASYQLRRAARAIVFNEEGKIAIMHVTADDYYKLPGGGVEDGEKLLETLRRECLEEAGIDIKLKHELGTVLERRDKHDLLQISYCYICNLDGEIKENNLTESEREAGFELRWFSPKEAMQRLLNCEPKTYSGEFIRLRAIVFLSEAFKILTGRRKPREIDEISEFIFVEDNLKEADVILVAGGSHDELAKRAALLYKNGLAPYVIPSGGKNERLKNHKTECEYMTEGLIKYGVPKEKILMEDEAAHTFENAELSLNKIKEHDINIKKVILVCKGFHSRRALMTYRSVFPDYVEFIVSPVPDRKDIKKDDWHKREDKTNRVMIELEKNGKYFRDKIDRLK